MLHITLSSNHCLHLFNLVLLLLLLLVWHRHAAREPADVMVTKYRFMQNRQLKSNCKLLTGTHNSSYYIGAIIYIVIYSFFSTFRMQPLYLDMHGSHWCTGLQSLTAHWAGRRPRRSCWVWLVEAARARVCQPSREGCWYLGVKRQEEMKNKWDAKWRHVVAIKVCRVRSQRWCISTY